MREEDGEVDAGSTKDPPRLNGSPYNYPLIVLELLFLFLLMPSLLWFPVRSRKR